MAMACPIFSSCFIKAISSLYVCTASSILMLTLLYLQAKPLSYTALLGLTMFSSEHNRSDVLAPDSDDEQ